MATFLNIGLADQTIAIIMVKFHGSDWYYSAPPDTFQ